MPDATAPAAGRSLPTDRSHFPASDSRLLRLVARAHALNASWAHALKALSDAQERKVLPPPPEALFKRDGDQILPLSLSAPRGRIFEQQAIDDAERFFLRDRDMKHRLRKGVGPKIRERLEEIVAASAAWNRAKKAAARAAGETEAERYIKRLGARRARLYAELGRTPARTLQGLAAKLSVAAYDVETFFQDFGDSSQIEHVLASAVLDSVLMTGDRAIAFSGKPVAEFVRELLALIGADGAAAQQ